MSTCRSGRTFAVVVTYFPDAGTLEALLRALLPQVQGIILVDNTPGDDRISDPILSRFVGLPIRLIRLGRNMGIGCALNEGIARALAVGADFVLLSDQDSLPAPDMVANLVTVHNELSAQGRSVAAVGPTYTDEYTGIEYTFQATIPGKFFYGHVAATTEQPVVEALTLITSGTLIASDVVRKVGGMREDFFIDHVDIEWCFRARAHGYVSYGTSLATMRHSMGDHLLRVWYMRWRHESAYSPLRVYYRIRNFVALCRAPHVPARITTRNSWYLLGMVYAQVVFGKQKLACLRMALYGLWDGALGRMGERKAAP